MPFVCIFDSSGTGKTQFAVTTAYVREEAKVVYLYTGKLNYDNRQEVYAPHMALWRKLNQLIADYCLNVSNGEAGQVGAQIMLDYENKHPLISAFNKILFDDYTDITISELRNNVDLLAKKIFVFVDEVPREGNSSANFNAIALRNFLRAIGIVPVLMSTHSGSHNAILSNADSRDETETNPPWCLVITKLPARVTANDGYLYQTERPLVERILSTLPTEQKASLASCVFAVRDHLLPAKKNTWRKSPIFQLCQLFRSTKDPSDRNLCSHLLVGDHFGHFELQQTTDVEEQSNQDFVIIYRNSVKLKGRIRMPEAEREPIMFLALTAWRTAELEYGKFPLQDSDGKALSVRQAFDMCQDDFSPDVFIQTPKAMKNDEGLMEVLALASMTLASLCSDKGLLSGVLLPDFVAMVYCFMLGTKSNDSLGSRLDHWRGSLRRFFDDEKNKDVPHGKMKVPPVPACDSEFPNLISPFEGSSLVRPRDGDKRDGVLSSPTSGGIVQVECKNYRNGLDTSTLKSVIERMRYNVKVTFLFTSKLNGIWKDGADLDAFMAEHGLQNGKLCILHLQEGKAPSWATTSTKVELKPGSECEYLLVVMSVAEVVVTSQGA